MKWFKSKQSKPIKFIVRETFGLFGDFDGDHGRCAKMPDCEIEAISPHQAIELYVEQWESKNNERHPDYETRFNENSSNFAKFRVTNTETGWKTYFG